MAPLRSKVVKGGRVQVERRALGEGGRDSEGKGSSELARPLVAGHSAHRDDQRSRALAQV